MGTWAIERRMQTYREGDEAITRPMLQVLIPAPLDGVGLAI